MVRRCAALLCLIGLAACASGRQFSADVTRFHGGETDWIEEAQVTFQPARPALAAEDFGRYAQVVGEELAKAGFLPAGDGPADIIARLDIEAIPVSAGSRTEIASYNRRIALTLIDSATGRHLWEGRAVSLGAVADIDYVLPFLARALLANFPGPPGESEEVEIPLTDEGGSGDQAEDDAEDETDAEPVEGGAS